MNNGPIDENQDPVVAEGVDESIQDENGGDSDIEIQVSLVVDSKYVVCFKRDLNFFTSI